MIQVEKRIIFLTDFHDKSTKLAPESARDYEYRLIALHAIYNFQLIIYTE